MDSSDLSLALPAVQLDHPRHLAGEDKLPHRVGEMGHPRRRFWRNRNIWPTRNSQREANYAQLASRSFGLVLLMRLFLFRQCSPCGPESCLLKSLRIFKLGGHAHIRSPALWLGAAAGNGGLGAACGQLGRCATAPASLTFAPR